MIFSWEVTAEQSLWWVGLMRLSGCVKLVVRFPLRKATFPVKSEHITFACLEGVFRKMRFSFALLRLSPVNFDRVKTLRSDPTHQWLRLGYTR